MRQRFFTNTKRLFGTNLLSMNPQTIRSICKSSKFHFSINSHLKNSSILDQITNILTQNKQQVISTNNINSELEVEEEVSLLEEIELINNLRNLNLCELMNTRGSICGIDRPALKTTEI